MADGVEGFLTRKLGPLPLWAYLGVAGGAVILFVLYRRGQSASSAQTSGALAVPSGVSPTTQGGFPPPSPDNPPSSTGGQVASIRQSMPNNPQTSGWDATHNGVGSSLAPGDGFKGPILPYGLTPVTLTGQQQTANGNVYYQVQTPFGNVWVLSWDLIVGQGMGGAAVALFGDGRHANPATQLSPTMVTTHVSTAGMGGGRHGVTGKTGGSHAGPLHTVHRQTGVPMLRLASLNPGFWRPGSGQPRGRVRVS